MNPSSGGRFGVIRNIGFSTITVYLELVAGLLISIIIARHLGPDRYGVYAFAIWLSGVTVGVANLGFANAAIKFIAEARGAEDPGLVQTVWKNLRLAQRWSAAVAVLVLAILIPLVFIHRVPSDYAPALWLLVAASAAKAMQMFGIGVAKGLERFGDIAAMMILVVPVNLALVIAAMMADLDVIGFVAIYTGTCVMGTLLMHYFNRRRLEKSPPEPLDPALKKRMVRHVSLVSIVIVVHMVGRQQIEIFFLSLYSSAENIAYFSLAFALSRSAAGLLPGVINQVLLPIFARTFAADPAMMGRKVLASIRYMLLVSVPVALPGWILAEDVILIVYGNDYLPAVLALQVFLTLLITQAIAEPCNGFLISSDHQHLNATMAVAAAVLNILLDILLIPRFGLTGAIAASAATTLVFHLIISALAMTLGRFAPALPVYLRILVAGGLGLLAAWPGLQLEAPVLRFLASLAGFLPVYVLATFWLRCWTEADLAILTALSARGGRLLGWIPPVIGMGLPGRRPRE